MRSPQAAPDHSLRNDIDRILISREQIARRIDELGEEISASCSEGELTLLCVLTGSVVFLADLIRRLPMKVRIEMISASSYPGEATTPQQLRLDVLPELDFAGRAVLVVDDILDSGRTLEAIVAEVRQRQAVSVRTCVLLGKTPSQGDRRIAPDFCGFSIGQEFVVGYGLDFNNLYRNLPDICLLKSHVMDSSEAHEPPAGGSGE